VVACGLIDRAKGGETVTAAQIKAVMESTATFRDQVAAQLAALAPGKVTPAQATMALNVADAMDLLNRGDALRQGEAVPLAPVGAETINQAAEAWFDEMQRDPSAAVKATTLEAHRLRVRAFFDHCGDIPLASVTRAMASDFLARIAQEGELFNRTVNNYATTLASVFKSARYRGRFQGDSPFEGQKRKAGGESYEAFETAELQTLFDSFTFETAPKHSPETALPWVSLIAVYSGARLEEIAQLAVGDIRDQGANGATVTVIDIYNGGNNALKNAASARLVPVHSELVRAGLLDYVKALPKDGPLFPFAEPPKVARSAPVLASFSAISLNPLA
jgi:integrase